MTALRIISPQKLDELRELIDESFAASRTIDECCFDAAGDAFVNKLGWKLRFSSGPPISSVAWLEPLYPLAVYPEHQGLRGFEEMCARQPCLFHPNSFVFAANRRCWAVSCQDAILGACCLALDENASIFMDECEQRRALPHNFIAMIELAELSIREFQGRKNDESPSASTGLGLSRSFSVISDAVDLLEQLAQNLRELMKGPEARFIAAVRDSMASGLVDSSSLERIESMLPQDDRVLTNNLLRAAAPIRQQCLYLNRIGFSHSAFPN